MLNVTRFELKANAAQVGEKVWYKFRISNCGEAPETFTGLGALIPGVMKKASYGATTLKPGASIEHEDWIVVNQPGLHPVSLGVCVLPNPEGPDSPWASLSLPRLLAVDVSFPPAPTNFLTNGGFDDPTPAPWQVYNLKAVCLSNLELASNQALLVYSGAGALRIIHDNLGAGQFFHSGVRQTCAVPKGQRLRLSAVAYGLAGTDVPENNQIWKLPSKLRVGVDPYGVGSYGNAVWSEVGLAPGWVGNAIETIAQADQVTVWVEAWVGSDWTPAFVAVVFDQIVLEPMTELPPAPPPPAPPPAAEAWKYLLEGEFAGIKFAATLRKIRDA